MLKAGKHVLFSWHRSLLPPHGPHTTLAYFQVDYMQIHQLCQLRNVDFHIQPISILEDKLVFLQ